MNRVSLCMILKNEEDWIEGALESVKNLTDEIVLVDTGSTDSTLDKVRRFSPRILSFDWIDDFAAARNVSLEAATCPWILVLDADERISERDIPALKTAINKGHDGFYLIQRNYVPSSNVIGCTPNNGEYEEAGAYPGYVDNPLIRLFRNSSDIRFRYAVHEIVDPTKMDPKFRFSHLPVPIHHYGKVGKQERLAQKKRMYLAIGMKKLERDPKNWKAHFELGVQSQELNKDADACKYFAQAWALAKVPSILLYWAVSEKHCGQMLRAAELIEQASRHGLKTSELHLELGNVYQSLGEFEKAQKEYQKGLKLQPASTLALFNSGLVFRKLGDKAEAERLYRRALKLEPTFREAALELASLMLDKGKFDEARQWLESVLDKDPDNREARLGLSKYFVQTGRSYDALRVLGELTERDSVAQCLAGAAHLHENELDQAQHYLESALKRDRTLVDARINLAQVYARRGEHAKAARYMMAAREQITVMNS
jgi:Tfp pilus assembly protein PilF/glycosyltransferase involved in cell wall biosynthesis